MLQNRKTPEKVIPMLPPATSPTASLTKAPITDADISNPDGFTGYSDEDGFTPEEKAVIEQRNDLREKSPYEGPGFQVIYNYRTFTFDVYFYSPMEDQLAKVDVWRKTNYPHISLDSFVISQIEQ